MKKLLLFVCSLAAAAPPPVYHLLWFDTEDYIEPAADDAALRLAVELEKRGVRATFKIVGEKARTLEKRGRHDVLRALARHEIGYHSDYHSIPPTPAVYLERLGLLEGAAEFERREGPGLQDLRRIFGVQPSCYGQPGSSWGPQTNLTLRRWGIPVYMDDGIHMGIDRQPFWFGGLLYVFNLGPYTLRADINDPARLDGVKRSYAANVAELQKRGGGVTQTYYHPTEFVTTEFWDGVNFSRGAGPEREAWRLPRRRTAESSEQAYRLMLEFVDYARSLPGVRFVTASELRGLMAPPDGRPPEGTARRLADSIDTDGVYSAADLLLSLLGAAPGHVDGPARRGITTYTEAGVPRAALERARLDAARFVQREGRLPDEVWIGSRTLSLADFAATLAGAGAQSPVPVRKGRLDLERHVATDAARAFSWAIHPEGFAPAALLDLARLQAWTLKPARLR